MKASKKNFAISVLILVIAMSILTSLWDMLVEPGQPEIFVKQEKAITEILTLETGRLIGHKGRVVLVTADTPGAKEQVDKYTAAIEKDEAVKVFAVEKLDMMKLGDTLAPGTIPSTAFRQIMEKYPGAAVVVSLLGVPELSKEDVAMLPQKMPKFVALSHTGIGVKDLFARKILQLAFVQKQAPPTVDPKKVFDPYSKEQLAALKKIPSWEIFDQRYQILTSDTDLALFHEMVVPPRPPMRPPPSPPPQPPIHK